ncbi:hypothetical protein ACSSS7_000625 [Eimeria intestinalis]
MARLRVFSDAVRRAHNSFRAETSFEVVEADDAKSKDAFHFVSYVPKGDKVYELDGLKQGPVCVGTTTEADWKEVVRKEVARRVEEIQAQGEELRFNLMAVTTNPLDSINAEVAKAQGLAAAATHKIEGKTPDASFDLPNEPEQLEKVRREAVDKVALLEEQLRAEEAKRAQLRRTHCEIRLGAEARESVLDYTLCVLSHFTTKVSAFR